MSIARPSVSGLGAPPSSRFGVQVGGISSVIASSSMGRALYLAPGVDELREDLVSAELDLEHQDA